MRACSFICTKAHSGELRDASAPAKRNTGREQLGEILPAASNAALKLHWQKPTCHKCTGNEMRELFVMINTLQREGQMLCKI